MQQRSLTLTSLVTASALTLSSDMLLTSSRSTHEEDMTLNKNKSVWQPSWRTLDGMTSPHATKNQDVPWCIRYWMTMLPSKWIKAPILQGQPEHCFPEQATPGPILLSTEILLATHHQGLEPHSSSRNQWGLHPHHRNFRQPSTSSHASMTVFCFVLFFHSAPCFYPTPKYLRSCEHSQIADAFYLVCLDNTPLHLLDANLAIVDYGYELNLNKSHNTSDKLKHHHVWIFLFALFLLVGLFLQSVALFQSRN